MANGIFPAERETADEALRVMRGMPPTLSVLYAELVRFQDGDRSAAGRAAELLRSLEDRVRELGQVVTRLSTP